ncbi:MAG: epoxyqueuosine reductase [Proteobacteria bacterium]|nr:epoxyqueuosine reductase [Pseudomonadota bacterium]
MPSKNEVIEQAQKLGFQDIGFTNADPFDSQKEVLYERREEYAHLEAGLALSKGVDPKNIQPEAKSIIVLMESYFLKSFPPIMEAHFGRCYLDDDRITKDNLAPRIKAFRGYLRDHGIQSKVPFNLPHRLAAGRSGLGSFGKNCLFYSNKVARRSSWVLPIAVTVDAEFEPDEPTMEVGCPEWCKNACISACPTKALKGSRKLDPRKCISNLSYYGEGLTPRELREPMGMWVYGCDHCQNVCPRNSAWLANRLPVNERVVAKVEDFDLSKLLHMDRDFFDARIWPNMFYIPYENIWRWKMNVARVMGNSLDPKYIPDLVRAFQEIEDERVKGMAAWALGRIGGDEAVKALNGFLKDSRGIVREEVQYALDAV